MEFNEEFVGIGLIDKMNDILEGMYVGVFGKFIEVDLFEEMVGCVIDIIGKMFYEESEEKLIVIFLFFCVILVIMMIDSVICLFNMGFVVIDFIMLIGWG